MRRRSKLLVATAFALSCLVGCLPVTAAKPVKPKPVATKPVAKPKPAPTKAAAPAPKPPVPVVAPVVAAAAPGDWTTNRANSAQTADNPDETSITAANVASLHQVWSAPSGANPWASTFPLVAGGLVFDSEISGGTTGDDYTTALTAYDLQTGAVRWQRTLDDQQQVIGVAYGLVLIGNPDFRFYSKVQAFDQKTGAPKWTWQAPITGQILGNVLTGSGHLLVPIAGALWALDPATGHELFDITCTSADVYCPFNLLNGTASAGDQIFAGGFGLSAGFEFSAVDGHRFNALGVPYTQTGYGAPLISGSQVFVRGGYMGADHNYVGTVASFSTVPCLSSSYCTPQWHVDVPGGEGSLAVADGRVFAPGSQGGTLEALNASNGQVLWQSDLAPDLTADASVAGNVLYIAQGLTISAYPVAGCAAATHCPPLWTLRIADLSNDLWAPIVVTGGRLLYVDRLGLHALAVS